MLTLHTTHPEAHQFQLNGEFVVQCHENKFGRIPQKQTIEVTIDRDTKTSGWLIGITLEPGAANKWALLRADWTEFLR